MRGNTTLEDIPNRLRDKRKDTGVGQSGGARDGVEKLKVESKQQNLRVRTHG
jgi:hypothetical protein